MSPDNLTREELALGWQRYEAIRKLTPRQFAEIHARNLKGEFFDSIIDQLIERGKPSKS